jgi:phosphate acetyltransferase
VRQGKAAALMKGSLHTDELLEPALDRIQGIRTERRISHCFVMAMPGRAEPFIVSDAAVNIAPTLADKADIVQNAIDLATALHWTDLRVAILSATEMINPAIKSTLDAAALCKMADRGQITGALIDGPLAFDNAIDQAAVSQKQINSPVAGRANILIVPDLESGNILAKSLSFMAHAEAAGIAMGARVPIILTSRADTVASRVVSCALAVLVSQIPLLKGIAKG